MNIIRRIIPAIIMNCASIYLIAQSPAFYHLSTAEGLSDNNVNIARRDQNGILWVGTTEGLNSFDGNRITTYFKYQNPELADNTIENIVIDNNNLIWVRTSSHQLTMLDKNRKFHLFNIGSLSDTRRITNLFHTKKFGIIAMRGNRHYSWKNNNSNLLEELRFNNDTLLPSNINFLCRIGDNKVLFYGDNRLIAFDYERGKALMELPLPNITAAAAINDNEVLAYPIDGKIFYRINISQSQVSETLTGLRDEKGKMLDGNLRNIARINENRFAITTRFSGLYILDIKNKSVQHWHHDPLDNRSIGGNNTYRIHYDSSGYLLVTTQTSGLHYINLQQPVAFSKSYFKDEGGEVFDGFIQSITTAFDGSVWIGGQDRLIIWDRVKDKTEFLKIQLPKGINLHGEETIRVVFTDEKGNVWVGTSRYGILVFDRNKKIIAHITDSLSSLPSNWINGISMDKAGNKWVATLRGIAMIDKDNFKVDDLTHHPALAKVRKAPSSVVWQDKTDRLWFGTTRGAWCFDGRSGKIDSFTTTNGMLHNNVFCFNEDDSGNIYAGTAAGLNIIQPNRSIIRYNRSNGLRNDRCEDILKDEKGFLWIGNLNCILRWDPKNKIFAAFEEGQGFNHGGFRMRSSHQSSTGEMFWGSDKGILYFMPEQMSRVSLPLYPSVNSVQTNDTIFRFTGNTSLRFPHYGSSIVFHFSSGELGSGKSNHYRYRLEGLDDDWKSPVVNGQAAFSRLNPGQYYFYLKASRDGITWYDASYPISVFIRKPWWQQTWIRALYIAAFILTVIWMYRYRQRRKKTIEIHKMVEYFAHSGYEHSSVNDILWDIARNCIWRLNFEDCVIYVFDEERKVLLQKAAFGPKNPTADEIANPIEIPIGTGIVGDVAFSGKPSLINDTSKDNRYIVDDERRNSEITVPIIHDGKVIAVIDSEHSSKGFFTQQDLQALQSIASLCSTKISRAMALEAMKKGQLELMELNMKMAESKFLNLRLQMNPHFLFNSLSSIQHLIVSQQTTRAYKYLTVFSNFLRTLLKYAEKNFIPLDEEVKILKMYIELESLRFDQSFKYNITVDESLVNEEVLVPTLMVQPFAENAIWHGLLHKEGPKELSLTFTNNSDDFLTCIIEDNGIGREKASSIRNNTISSMVHESKGIHIIKERLDLLQQKTGKPASVSIEDLFDEMREPTGTRVVITIPYYNPDES